MDKAELIITALQQRIGEMSAQYELEKAVLRAEYTDLKSQFDQLNEQKAMDEYSQEVAQKAGL